MKTIFLSITFLTILITIIEFEANGAFVNEQSLDSEKHYEARPESVDHANLDYQVDDLTVYQTTVNTNKRNISIHYVEEIPEDYEIVVEALYKRGELQQRTVTFTDDGKPFVRTPEVELPKDMQETIDFLSKEPYNIPKYDGELEKSILEEHKGDDELVVILNYRKEDQKDGNRKNYYEDDGIPTNTEQQLIKIVSIYDYGQFRERLVFLIGSNKQKTKINLDNRKMLFWLQESIDINKLEESEEERAAKEDMYRQVRLSTFFENGKMIKIKTEISLRETVQGISGKKNERSRIRYSSATGQKRSQTKIITRTVTKRPSIPQSQNLLDILQKVAQEMVGVDHQLISVNVTTSPSTAE